MGPRTASDCFALRTTHPSLRRSPSLWPVVLREQPVVGVLGHGVSIGPRPHLVPIHKEGEVQGARPDAAQTRLHAHHGHVHGGLVLSLVPTARRRHVTLHVQNLRPHTRLCSAPRTRTRTRTRTQERSATPRHVTSQHDTAHGSVCARVCVCVCVCVCVREGKMKRKNGATARHSTAHHMRPQSITHPKSIDVSDCSLETVNKGGVACSVVCVRWVTVGGARRHNTL